MKDYFIKELRSDSSKDKFCFRFITGCYVDSSKTQVATFRKRLGSLKSEDADKYRNILRNSISGTFGRTLFSLNFRGTGLDDGQQKDIFSAVRSNIEDDAALDKLYKTIIDAYNYQDNYLILVSDCTHDIVSHTKDDKKSPSTEVFKYILCTICPVSREKPALTYLSDSKDFSSRILDWIVSTPTDAFIYPDRRARKTVEEGLVLFSRKIDTLDHNWIVEGLGCFEPNARAFYQKEFNRLIESLTKDAPEEGDILKALPEAIKKAKKSNKRNSDKYLEPSDIRQLLSDSNASQETINKVDSAYESVIGSKPYIPLSGISKPNGTTIKSANVSINIKPGCEDLYKTQTIDGVKYILISAEEGASVNGISIA